VVVCIANKQLARDHGHQKRLKPNCGMVVLFTVKHLTTDAGS